MSQNNIPKDPNGTDPFDTDFDDEFFKELDEIQNSTSSTPQKPVVDVTVDFDEPFMDSKELPNSNESDDLSFLDNLQPDTDFNINNLQATSDDTRLSDALNAVQPEPVEEPEPVVAPIPTKTKKSLFGGLGKGKDKPKKSKDTTPILGKKSAKPSTPKSKAGDSKKLNLLILAAVLGLLLLVAAWFLMQGGEEVAPEPTPTPVATQPTPPVAPEPVVAEEAPTTDTVTPAEPATSAEDSATPTDATLIDADAIVNAEIPSDDALIKEEIDRLKDKDGQLVEQAKLIDEQLADLEDLTAAKEEQIALLEKQIALLEEQKNTSK